MPFTIHAGTTQEPDRTPDRAETVYFRPSSGLWKGLGQLTVAESRVLDLMADGCSNSAVAERLGMDEAIVAQHVQGVFAKLGLKPSHAIHRRVLAVLAYVSAPGRSGRANDRESLVGRAAFGRRRSVGHVRQHVGRVR